MSNRRRITATKDAKANSGESRVLKLLNGAKKPEEIAELLEEKADRKWAVSAARKLINYRNKNGNFKTLRDAAAVPQLEKASFVKLISRLSDIETIAPVMGAPSFLVNEQVVDGLSVGLVEFSIEECKTHGPKCEAVFSNWDSASANPGFLWDDRSTLDFGKRLWIKARAGVFGHDLFKGTVIRINADYPVNASPRVSVAAANPHEVSLNITRRTRTFEDMSDGEAIRRVASDHNMQVEMDNSGEWHKILIQAGQSDMEFIRERANSMGAKISLAGYELHVRAADNTVRQSDNFKYGQRLTEFSVKAGLEGQATSVTAYTWNVNDKNMNSHTTRDTAVWESGQSGSSILRQQVGEVGIEVTQAGADFTELQTLADTRFGETARHFVRGSGKISGYAGIRVGEAVTLSGLGSIFSGKYYVGKVKLTYSPASGYVTYFEVERSVISPG